MKLYIGGADNGQRETAALETGLTPALCSPEAALSAPCIDKFHLTVRELLQSGGDAREFARELLEKNPDAVVICDEIGLGIVPLDPFERRWREDTGRALCILAEGAERVTRVYCGIPQVIK